MTATFALVTPSYYVDFERCAWLCETVARHVPEHVTHYLLVDRADVPLFSPLASSRTRIIPKEQVLRGRVRQVPFARKWWLTSRGRPVRGWIVQQLAKLFAHRVVTEDVLAFVDSGAFFVRSYDPTASLQGDRVPLFREEGAFFRGSPATERWHRAAAALLGLPVKRGYDRNYVNALVTWRRANLPGLHERIEQTTGRSSMDALAACSTLSEYIVYGMYSEDVLGDAAGHYVTSLTGTHSHWSEVKLAVPELRRMRETLKPEHVLVMVNEKSRTPLEAVREAFRA